MYCTGNVLWKVGMEYYVYGVHKICTIAILVKYATAYIATVFQVNNAQIQGYTKAPGYKRPLDKGFILCI